MHRVVIAAAAEPVTLADAKVHLRAADGTDEDALIGGLISAAREIAEHYTGRALAPQTLEMALPGFPFHRGLASPSITWRAGAPRVGSGVIELDMPPVASVTSIKYTDPLGVEQTLDQSKYRLSAFGAQRNVVPTFGNEWPCTACDPEAVRIQYVTGYTSCPQAARSAMLLIIGHLYENRQDAVIDHAVRIVELPMGALALLDTVKVWAV